MRTDFGRLIIIYDCSEFVLIFTIFVDNVTIYFLKDLISSKKSYVPNDQVETLYVPQYKNLSLEKEEQKELIDQLQAQLFPIPMFLFEDLLLHVRTISSIRL